MKKFMYLFIAATLLISCGANEEADEVDGGDLIVGKWQYVSEKEDGVDISTSCSRMSSVEFLGDGTLVTFYFNNYNGPCEAERNEGSWSSPGSNKYQIGFLTWDARFSNNNNRLTLTTNDGGIITENVIDRI